MIITIKVISGAYDVVAEQHGAALQTLSAKRAPARVLRTARYSCYHTGSDRTEPRSDSVECREVK